MVSQRAVNPWPLRAGWFDPSPLHFICESWSQVVAPALGAGVRQFESDLADFDRPMV